MNMLTALPVEGILRITRENGATAVRVFGLRARGDANDASDLDLLVELEPARSLLDLVGMKLALEDFLAFGSMGSPSKPSRRTSVRRSSPRPRSSSRGPHEREGPASLSPSRSRRALEHRRLHPRRPRCLFRVCHAARCGRA